MRGRLHVQIEAEFDPSIYASLNYDDRQFLLSDADGWRNPRLGTENGVTVKYPAGYCLGLRERDSSGAKTFESFEPRSGGLAF